MTDTLFWRAVSLYQSGLCFREISERLNVSATTLCTNFKKQGISTRSNGGKYPIDVDLAQKLYEDGHSLREVARRCGCTSENTIGNLFRKQGIPVRTKAGVGDTVNHYYFSIINTEEKAYFAGLLLADGNITIRKHSQPAVRIELQKQDRYILERFKNCIETSNNVTACRECYRIAIHSNKIVGDLERLGIIPNKTGRKHFLIDEIPLEFQRDFVRGFFDGNGWITNAWSGKYQSYRVGFSDGKDCLSELLDFLCDKLNVFRVKIVEHSGTSMIVFGSVHDVCNLLHFMYDDSRIYLNRKYLKVVDCIGNAERDCSTVLCRA